MFTIAPELMERHLVILGTVEKCLSKGLANLQNRRSKVQKMTLSKQVFLAAAKSSGQPCTPICAPDNGRERDTARAQRRLACIPSASAHDPDSNQACQALQMHALHNSCCG